MERKLRIGDVIHLSQGTRVRTNVESKFVHDNIPFSDKKVCGTIEIGHVYLIDVSDKKELLRQELPDSIDYIFSSYGMSVDKEKVKQLVDETILKYKSDYYEYDSKYLIGDYVVTEVGDNHHVYCRKLQNGQYDEKGVVIDFYQDRLFSPSIMENEISLEIQMKLCFI
ncbi:hypothetical protein [Hungatella hathewayi]|uniref:hypothetical protein n=1 Tax=Hungatella hathewayi TaxID=154046 RepID=UPI003566C655